MYERVCQHYRNKSSAIKTHRNVPQHPDPSYVHRDTPPKPPFSFVIVLGEPETAAKTSTKIAPNPPCSDRGL